jgi:hypothetical protein
MAENARELQALLDRVAALAGGHDRGNQADQARDAAAAAYDLGLRHAGEALAAVLTDLIDTSQLHSPGGLAALVPLLPVPQQAVAESAAADLKDLAGADHDAFLAELDARMARFSARVQSGSPEGRAEMARFLGAMFADAEVADNEDSGSWVTRLLREQRDAYEAEFDLDEAMARYEAAVRRYDTDPEYRARIARLIAEADAQLAGQADGRCPDGATCHHGCSRGCFRVRYAGPLTGVYPGDDWPDEIKAAHPETDGAL